MRYLIRQLITQPVGDLGQTLVKRVFCFISICSWLDLRGREAIGRNGKLTSLMVIQFEIFLPKISTGYGHARYLCKMFVHCSCDRRLSHADNPQFSFKNEKERKEM